MQKIFELFLKREKKVYENYTFSVIMVLNINEIKTFNDSNLKIFK